MSKELLLSFIWNRHQWPRLFMRTSSKSFHKRNSGDSIWIIHLIYSKTCSYNNNSLFGSVKHYFICKNKCWERLQCWSGVWCARPRPGAIAWRNRSPTHTTLLGDRMGAHSHINTTVSNITIKITGQLHDILIKHNWVHVMNTFDHFDRNVWIHFYWKCGLGYQ